MTLSLSVSEAQREAHTEILNGSNIISITFSATDVDNGKVSFINNKEIRYLGKMYDVFSASRNGNVFTLRVFHDEKEEGVLSEIEETIHSWLDDPIKDLSKHLAFKYQLLQDIIPSGQADFVFSQPFKTLSLVPDQVSILHRAPEIIISPPRLA